MATRNVIRKDQRGVGDFNEVIDGICKGNYVLVLGSEVMLDKNRNIEAKGDSVRFYLEEIINSRHDMGFNHIPAENFTDYIIKNALNTDSVKKWLLEQIEEISFEDTDINPDLVRLMESKFFRVVLATTFDPSAEILMNKVWGKGNYRIMDIYNSNNNFDFGKEELSSDEYYDIQPTLYYAFGKAIPDNGMHQFVLNDNDTLRCISNWLGEKRPDKLMEYIQGKNLLVLGCNLKDWCFRFFWYAMRKNTELKRGDIAVLLNPETSEQDKNLYQYLHDIVGVRIQPDSRSYLKRLADALDTKRSVEECLNSSRLGGIFISYASEDFATAWNIFSRLRENGYNVWLDNRKLSVGDEYDTRIKKAIAQCKVFMPILSSTVAEHLASDQYHYYRNEWEWATPENSDKHYFPIVTDGYDYRAPYHVKVPGLIRKVSAFNWSTTPFNELLSKLKAITWK